MKKVLMLASVASMIDQFNMGNIGILKEQGYEVHVAANFEQGSTSSSDRMEKFKQELKELNIQYYQIDFSRNITNILENIKAYNQIKKIMSENNYEFVHCHSPIGGVCGRLAAKVTKTKVIYTAHGFHFFKGASKLNWILYYPIEKILSYITDILITINHEDYHTAKKKMKAKQIYYIHGIGVDTKIFNNVIVDKEKKKNELNMPKDAVVLLSVGELNKNKNHEIIIRALAKLNNKKVYYCIAGKGSLKSYLEKLANSLNISEQVYFLGFRTDINKLYKVSDVFCFPSYREGLSVAMMEAMASGLPVVCSDIRGNTDLIKNGQGGYLCKPNSVDSFEKAIRQLISSNELVNSMIKINQSNIKTFDNEIVVQEMNKIYNLI